jgi:hypothetical protein
MRGQIRKSMGGIMPKQPSLLRRVRSVKRLSGLVFFIKKEVKRCLFKKGGFWSPDLDTLVYLPCYW